MITGVAYLEAQLWREAWEVRSAGRLWASLRPLKCP